MASSVNPHNEFGPGHQGGEERNSAPSSSSGGADDLSQCGPREQLVIVDEISLPKVPESNPGQGAGVTLLRDPRRIGQVLALLREVWGQDPGSSFVGLLSSLLQDRSIDEFSDPSSRLWNCEEYEWVGLLNTRRNEAQGMLGCSDIHEAVLGELHAVWHMQPDLRLGQLVIVACGKAEGLQGGTIHISAIQDTQLVQGLAIVRQQWSQALP